MHSHAIIVSSLAATVLAQGSVLDNEFPQCAKDCIPQLSKVVGCEADNFACFCLGRNQIAHMVAPCLMSHCTGREMAHTQELVEKTCTRMGYPTKRDTYPVCTSGICPGYAPAPAPAPAPEVHPIPEAPGPVIYPTGGEAPSPSDAPEEHPAPESTPAEHGPATYPAGGEAPATYPAGGEGPAATYPAGGEGPSATYAPAPPSKGNGSEQAPPSEQKPPVTAGSSAMHAGLGLMGGAILVAASVL